MEYTPEQLKQILDAHRGWRLSDGAKGKCANLSGADLWGADLSRAYLSGADLSRANLSRANLSGAGHVIDAGTPNGWRCVGWMRGGTLRVRVGCRDKTIAEGREYWRGKDERREVMAALDYVEAIAKLRAETDEYWVAK